MLPTSTSEKNGRTCQDAFENWIGFGTFGSLQILTFGLRDSFGSRGSFAGSSVEAWRDIPIFSIGFLIDNRWCKISEPSTVAVDYFTQKENMALSLDLVGFHQCTFFAVVVPLLKLFEEVKNFLRLPNMDELAGF